jgi:antitoxin (DNA-binding transcriptional repressor) of toxin-antitoxin stability system
MDASDINLNNSIDLADFKLRCLEILEQLAAPGLIVTKEGRPLARITPVAAVNNEPLIGSMKGQIAIHGDIFSTGIEWDAQS